MATILCDFVEIVGDTPINVTSTAQTINFNTGGRIASGTQSSAFLLFNVRGLTNPRLVPVRVNDRNVGSIFPYSNSNVSYWYTQMIALTGNQLNSGDNQILLEAVDNDQFEIKNMVCFFHQSD